MPERCPEPLPECPYQQSGYCHISEHHLFWPRRDYQTHIERAFRELEENKEPLRRCEHDQVHIDEEPPVKPGEAAMLDAIAVSGMYMSRSLRKNNRGEKTMSEVPEIFKIETIEGALLITKYEPVIQMIMKINGVEILRGFPEEDEGE